ncbi:MAG: Gfo/Idh/MocA family protein [Kiritimatiellia bacterium]
MSLRMGIVGFGGNAGMHQKYLRAGVIPDCELTAIADINPQRLEAAVEMYGDDVKRFADAESLLDAKVVDAVIICTPHYDHPTIAIQAFKRGVHVLSEKPAGVYTRQVREMNEAAERSGCVFGIMFNQRTLPLYQKIRALVKAGEIGKIVRFQWTITNWFRTQSYYDSGGWRATWSGEGGGVLTNQCPHNLDLWQWMLGMPRRIRAFCNIAKHHRIEVEDEATIYAEYADGAVGVFVSSTGEAPGINRLEIAGERGLLIADGGN